MVEASALESLKSGMISFSSEERLKSASVKLKDTIGLVRI
jgi:hypothetical protein